MQFLLPTALWSLASLGALVVIWLFARKRERIVIPSLIPYLHLPESPPALRLPTVNLLFFLQLLLLAALALALAKPLWSKRAAPTPGKEYVVLVDTSASMGAHLPGGTAPMDEARAQVQEQIKHLQPQDRLLLVQSAPPQLLTPTPTSDQGALRQLAKSLTATDAAGNLARAAALARGVVRGSSRLDVTVYTDEPPPASADRRGQAGPPAEPAGSTVRVVSLGRPLPNVGIRAFEVSQSLWDPRQAPTAYLTVQNFAAAAARVEVQALMDGHAFFRQTITLAPEASQTLPIGGFDPATRELTATIAASPDALAVDDASTVVIAQSGPLFLNVASPSDDLRRLLQRLAQVNARFRVQTAAPGQAAAAGAGLAVLHRGALLDPSQPSLAIAPTEGVGATGDVLRNVRVVDWDATHPINRYVEQLDHLTLPEVRAVALPPWAVPVVWGSDGKTTIPLVAYGTAHGARRIVWAFDVTGMNLTDPANLDVLLLLLNGLGWLAPSSAVPHTIATGDAVALAGVPAGTVALTDPRKERTTWQHTGGTLTVTQTAWAGLYTVERPDGQQRFAAHLLDPDEMDLAHRRSTLETVTWLRGETAPAMAPPPAGLPLWPWLVALVMGLLLLEWCYYGLRTRRPTAT